MSAVKAREANKARWDQSVAAEKQGEADLRKSEAELAQSRAELEQAIASQNQNALLLEKFTVRSPVHGKVLQVNSRVGEYISSTPATPPVVLGETGSLLVLADVNESDASRATPVSSATASLKGNPSRSFPLKFQRVVPFMVPKKNLTGSNSERVDVRVLQIEFRFTPPPFPVYVGQQLDVFIKTGELGAGAKQ
jgi:multidrug resistance efflux pump